MDIESIPNRNGSEVLELTLKEVWDSRAGSLDEYFSRKIGKKSVITDFEFVLDRQVYRILAYHTEIEP